MGAVEPYLDDLVVAAECIFCWYWLADLCARNGITLILAHALYLKAIHGAKTKNDRVDAEKLVVLLRGGVIPQAYVCPTEMRATRDLLRRRLFFTRKRGELLPHVRSGPSSARAGTMTATRSTCSRPRPGSGASSASRSSTRSIRSTASHASSSSAPMRAS